MSYIVEIKLWPDTYEIGPAKILGTVKVRSTRGLKQSKLYKKAIELLDNSPGVKMLTFKRV